MNFNIVEGENYMNNIDFTQFKKDYFKFNPTELMRKYDLSKKKYYEVVHKLGLPCRINQKYEKKVKPHNTDLTTPYEPKYYTWNKQSKTYWVVRQGTYYGCYQTEKEAQKRVKELKNNGWMK